MGNGNEKGYIGVYSGIENIKPVSSLKRTVYIGDRISHEEWDYIK